MNSQSEAIQRAKEAAGRAAAELVRSGMRVGLGTGSTASFFVTHLAERCRQGLHVQAVATSEQAYAQAVREGISMENIDTIRQLDLVVDGADAVDRNKRLIKGGGGALLREKIVASMAKEMIVIVDWTKEVDAFGHFPLPVEIVPFAYPVTIHKIEVLGFKGRLRETKPGQLFVTDNRNYIFDVQLPYPFTQIEQLENALKQIPGVLETGFFIGFAKRVIVGFADGHTEVRA